MVPVFVASLVVPGVAGAAAPVEVAVLHVGSRAAMLVRGPCGDVGLVDAGRGAADDVLAQLDRWGDRDALRWVAVTTADAEHVADVVQVARATGTRLFLDDPVATATDGSYAAYEAFADRRVRRHLDVGDGFALCAGPAAVTFRVLAAGGDGTTAGARRVASVDDRGVLLRMDHGDFTLVTGGDVGRRVEQAVVATGRAPDADVAVVGGMGAVTSSGGSWTAALDADAAITSTGGALAARDGLPSALVRDRWEGTGATWWQTGRPGTPRSVDGDVTVTVQRDGAWRLVGSTGRRQAPAVPARARTRTTTDTCTRDAVFDDVPPASVFAGTIGCVAQHGITSGTGRDGARFDPTGVLTRGQLAAFLVRTAAAADAPLPAPTADDDGDDGGGGVFGDDLAAVVAAGIYPDEAATGPTAAATRLLMARATTRLLVHVGLTPDASTDWFPDAGSRADALAVAGIVVGDDDGTFGPSRELTRGQFSAFAARTLDAALDGSVTSDVPPQRARAAVTPATLPRHDAPSGTAPTAEGWRVVRGSSAPVGTGPVRRYTVELADGLQRRQDPDELAAFVDQTLLDTLRGWTTVTPWTLQRTDDPSAAAVRLLLATPSTVDRLCARAGLDTGGRYSCWNGEYAVINADRWFGGVPHVRDLTLYRQYVVNHEVGHGLGLGHRSCPGPGRTAPVMMQLTKSTYGCVPNGWPNPP